MKYSKKLSYLIPFYLIILQAIVTRAEVPIFPVPLEVVETGGNFNITESTTILLPQNPSKHDLFLARLLMAELGDRYLIPVFMTKQDIFPKDVPFILMGTITNLLVEKFVEKNNITNLNGLGDEGYVLRVSENSAVVAANTDVGAFYGFQSLRQLMHKNSEQLNLPQVMINDKPAMPFRGIRLYIPGPENISFFKRFIRDFMALYKFNKIILEVNGVMRLDHHPEINVGAIEFANEMNYSRRGRPLGPGNQFQDSAHHDAGDGKILEKAEVIDLIEYVRQFHIEVIPEIPSLTHVYYLLNRHRELAEIKDAEWPDTYCPSNPDSYKLLFDVYEEYIEVIQPKMIHIGKDEWRMPVHVCPLCKDKDYRELFVKDVNKIHNYLSSKGVKVAMWGDHLLESVREKGFRHRATKSGYKYSIPGAITPEQVKNSIPKDILVFNWFWGDQKNDRQVQEFGFKQVYGNFRPNISNWTERSQLTSVLGGAPSSWAATTEFNFGKDLLHDFLGCANLLWSSNQLDQRWLAQTVQNLMPVVRSCLSDRQIPSADENLVVPVNIAPYFNINTKQDIPAVILTNLKSGKLEANGKIFRLIDPEKNEGKCAIYVRTVTNDENPSMTGVNGISLDEDVSSLIFLHACSKPAGNEKAYRKIYNFDDTADLLGWYEIVYEDDYVQTIPIRYGVNILEWNIRRPEKVNNWPEGRTGAPQDIYCYSADIVDCSQNMIDTPINFFAFEWKNKRFGKKIKEINLKGTKGYKSYKDEQIEENAIIFIALSVTKKRDYPKME